LYLYNQDCSNKKEIQETLQICVHLLDRGRTSNDAKNDCPILTGDHRNDKKNEPFFVSFLKRRWCKRLCSLKIFRKQEQRKQQQLLGHHDGKSRPIIIIASSRFFNTSEVR
jgi:hypothetical protein